MWVTRKLPCGSNRPSFGIQCSFLHQPWTQSPANNNSHVLLLYYTPLYVQEQTSVNCERLLVAAASLALRSLGSKYRYWSVSGDARTSINASTTFVTGRFCYNKHEIKTAQKRWAIERSMTSDMMQETERTYMSLDNEVFDAFHRKLRRLRHEFWKHTETKRY